MRSKLLKHILGATLFDHAVYDFKSLTAIEWAYTSLIVFLRRQTCRALSGGQWKHQQCIFLITLDWLMRPFPEFVYFQGKFCLL
ncbi:hypothetical protein FGO68_gene17044 [Halteria grandinella]|uniref:Uncharacterized protein n=1 Tax=Halteria grandinella TaxID=5974 RepID=A0A8J8NB18_HALGN|nr:hypothetical protein FGO68_gene17044 [Halteria grandinella]